MFVASGALVMTVANRNITAGTELSQVYPPIAVVELFTSEGCSSCPPADDVLAELERDAADKGKRILPLSFHVDYWNQLGWTDLFSASDFSKRQRKYAEVFGLTSIYTPQMVVNGAEEFVGSQKATAMAKIAIALAKPATAGLRLRVGSWSEGPLTLAYTAVGAVDQSHLTIALVERGLERRITGGENSGRTLRHENVVRRMKNVSLAVSKSGSIDFEVPADAKRAKLAILAYIQEDKSLEVLGGSRVNAGDTQWVNE